MINERVDELLKQYSKDTAVCSFNQYGHPAAVELHEQGKEILPRLLYWLKLGNENDWKDEYFGWHGLPVWMLISLIGSAMELEPPPREHMGELAGMKLDEEVDWILENAKEYE